MAIVTLVSGGFDSTLMSLMARDGGAELFPLFVDYGQLAAKREWDACQLQHRTHRLPEPKRIVLADFGKVIPSGITNATMRINEDAFLPGRNFLLLLVGASHAYNVQADSVAIGLLNPQYHLFPDQTPEFISQVQASLRTALNRDISILTPLFGFGKADILRLASERGVIGTYSCHSGNETPCGKCISCLEIANAQKGR